jgi:hypothetical protein
LVTLKYQHFLGDNKAYARDNESKEGARIGKSQESICKRQREQGRREQEWARDNESKEGARIGKSQESICKRQREQGRTEQEWARVKKAYARDNESKEGELARVKKAYARDNESKERARMGKSQERVVRVRRE